MKKQAAHVYLTKEGRGRPWHDTGRRVDDQLPSNPCHTLGKIHSTEQANNDANSLSRNELTLPLNAFKKHYHTNYPLALLPASASIRVVEALALQWDDFDFNSRFITEQRSITPKDKIETPQIINPGGQIGLNSKNNPWSI